MDEFVGTQEQIRALRETFRRISEDGISSNRLLTIRKGMKSEYPDKVSSPISVSGLNKFKRGDNIKLESLYSLDFVFRKKFLKFYEAQYYSKEKSDAFDTSMGLMYNLNTQKNSEFYSMLLENYDIFYCSELGYKKKLVVKGSLSVVYKDGIVSVVEKQDHDGSMGISRASEEYIGRIFIKGENVYIIYSDVDYKEPKFLILDDFLIDSNKYYTHFSGKMIKPSSKYGVFISNVIIRYSSNCLNNGIYDKNTIGSDLYSELYGSEKNPSEY